MFIFVLHNPELVNTLVREQAKGIYEWHRVIGNNKRALHKYHIHSAVLQPVPFQSIDVNDKQSESL